MGVAAATICWQAMSDTALNKTNITLNSTTEHFFITIQNPFNYSQPISLKKILSFNIGNACVNAG